MMLTFPLPVEEVPEQPPLPPVQGVPDRRQHCVGVEEDLVPVKDLRFLDAYAELGILPARRLLLRSSVVERLQGARRRLSAPFDLLILDGYRTIAEQQRLLLHYQGVGPTDGFVASLDADAIRPPHTTGGAVDLTLSRDGVPLALGTDFDAFDDAARLHAFESLPGIVRELRRMLAWCLLTSGFVPYELEWWHWSYGDDVWAASTGQAALYDVIPDLDGR